MGVDFFIVSEGAYNHDGSFTIVNTFDILKADKFPFKTNLGVSLKLSFNKTSVWEKDFKLKLYKIEDNQELYNLGGNMPEKQEDEGKLAMAANVQGLVIPSAGEYKMILFLGETPKAEYSFKVVENGK